MLLFSFSLYAQTPDSKPVKGQITDGAIPIPGATIQIKGASRGTVSDFEGHYEINAQTNDTLLFSYIGYTTVQEPVGNRATINVTLQQDATTLREVVINAGYYTVKDRERTGSISRVTAKEIEQQPVNNPLEALQGRMPGVDIVQSSGVPGGGFEVRIRGQNSIMAGNAPLYVIDGVPLDPATLGSGNSSGTIIPGGRISPLNALNPDSIESIEVLKDADATAIYGSRGANGVVLITTKKGQKGKTKWTLTSQTGIAHTTLKRDLLNTKQYLEMRREAFENDDVDEYPTFAYDVNGTWDQDRDTDWQEVLIGNTANFQTFQLGLSGGDEQTQFRVTGRTQKETTVFPGDFDYNRIALNSNVRHSALENKFTMSWNTAYTLQENNLPFSDLSRVALILPPNAPELYNDEGELNWEEGTWDNPLAQLNGSYTNKIHTLLASTNIKYTVFKNLDLRVNAGYTTTNLKDTQKRPHTIYNPNFGLDSQSSSATVHQGSKSSFIIEPQIQWSRNGEVSDWSLLFGGTVQNKKTEVLTMLAEGVADNSLLGDLSAANTLRFLNENNSEYKYNAFFARINYSFKDKVYLNATGRRDGSSRFGPGKRYGNFGAIGAAWIFSKEINEPWLSFGKLRASYGITGNDQINDYEYMNTYTISDFPYNGNIGLEPARLYNANYQWEQNEKKEIALELSLFKNRLNINTAYFNNRSSNQLINYALPGTTGFTSIQANLDALVQNSGWEFDISGKLINNINLKWNAAVNLSLPNNKLLEFPGLENSTYANQFVIGQPLNIVKLYKFNGVNPETGLYEFEDFNGDGEITAADDREYIADFTPEYFGGIATTLTYKNWSLNAFLQFVKRKAPNEYFNTEPPGAMLNQPIGVLNNWQQPGDEAPIQQYTAGLNFDAYQTHTQFITSDAAVADASFVRLKTMALSYDLPLPDTAPLSCKLTLQGQNLFTWTKFKGGDPEQTYGFLPQLRRMAINIQVHF